MLFLLAQPHRLKGTIMNTTTNDLNEFLTTLKNMGDRKVIDVKVTAVGKNETVMAGLETSSKPLDGACSGTDYFKAVKVTIAKLESQNFTVTEIDYKVHNLSFMERGLDISVSDVNITGQTARDILRIERGMTINLNTEDYYVKPTTTVTAWKLA